MISILLLLFWEEAICARKKAKKKNRDERFVFSSQSLKSAVHLVHPGFASDCLSVFVKPFSFDRLFFGWRSLLWACRS